MATNVTLAAVEPGTNIEPPWTYFPGRAFVIELRSVSPFALDIRELNFLFQSDAGQINGYEVRTHAVSGEGTVDVALGQGQITPHPTCSNLLRFSFGVTFQDGATERFDADMFQSGTSGVGLTGTWQRSQGGVVMRDRFRSASRALPADWDAALSCVPLFVVGTGNNK